MTVFYPLTPFCPLIGGFSWLSRRAFGAKMPLLEAL